ncbi:hypothetical protein H6P81_005219 [Aristolochia fimbriata]|uniref:RING-type domain-containing protein n=1 Tax=Aristolochia fimbriata TaxID=158543 RepID=A0AAV7ETV0_ARIFI|nr:hypothetical protein H6P81_005219 [Aristolochia fimbriata]
MATAIFIPPPILPPPQLPDPPPPPPLSFSVSYTASPQAMQTPPIAYVTISIQENYLVWARESRSGSSYYVDDEHTEVVHGRTYPVPLGSLFNPSLWKETLSVMLADYSLLLGREACARLLSLLWSQAPAKAADAYRRGFTRLDVALDVVHRTAVDRLPPPRRRGRRTQVSVPPPLPPQVVLVDDSSEGARETSHQEEEKELCSICLEELREDESTKTVTRTPCSHLFHSECLLPWLNNANTCPVCRAFLF